MRPTQTLVAVSSISVQKRNVRTLEELAAPKWKGRLTNGLSVGVVALLDIFDRAVPTSR